MTKECTGCREAKPLEAFGTHARKNRTPGKQYVNSRCRACVNAAWDSARGRDLNRQRRYGISNEQFEAMLTEQGGCAICGRTESNGKYWHIDHDHACCDGPKSCGNCVRAVLCHGCNTALGNVNDDISILNNMIKYLEKHCG